MLLIFNFQIGFQITELLPLILQQIVDPLNYTNLILIASQSFKHTTKILKLLFKIKPIYTNLSTLLTLLTTWNFTTINKVTITIRTYAVEMDNLMISTSYYLARYQV